MSHFFDDTPGQATAPREDRAAYDALAELFMSDEPAPTLRLSTSSANEPIDASDLLTETDPPERAALTSETSADTEALVLGHLPVLAGAWAAQHARSRAEETDRPVALARFVAGSATLQLTGTRHELGELPEETTLENAVNTAAIAQPAWSIRVEATSELDLASAPHVSRITLLSGADEAAIVAAYRTLKGICETLPADDERTIAVRIMGASDEDADDAAKKIRRASAAFLNRAIDFLPPIQQINAGAGTTLFRGPTEDGFETVLAAINTLDPANFETPAHQTENDHTPTPSSHTLTERAGMTPLELRCDPAPSVEFATDELGRLHILAEGDDAIENLLAAEGWVNANTNVILRAVGLDPDAEIIPRILTDNPARDRRLLDSRYRVDLLREVRVGEHSTWCRVPLNSAD